MSPEKGLCITEQTGVVSSEKKQMVMKQDESAKLTGSANSGKSKPVYHHPKNLRWSFFFFFFFFFVCTHHEDMPI